MEKIANGMAVVEAPPMSVTDVRNQVNRIQEIMRSVMKKDEHYGVIPGCGDKPTLLKPGTEKLILTFRLVPDPQVECIDMGNDHREYRVRVPIYTLSGTLLGTGLGSASTKESKWRYRWDNTGKPVPGDYWKHRDKELIGGETFTARKVAGKWLIFRKVEHDNPADYYNTCVKMAKKRGMADGVLTVTAASDVFTQDIEDEHIKETVVEADIVAEKQEKVEPKKEAEPIENGKVEAVPDVDQPADELEVALAFKKTFGKKCNGWTLGDIWEKEPDHLKWIANNVTGREDVAHAKLIVAKLDTGK